MYIIGFNLIFTVEITVSEIMKIFGVCLWEIIKWYAHLFDLVQIILFKFIYIGKVFTRKVLCNSQKISPRQIISADINCLGRSYLRICSAWSCDQANYICRYDLPLGNLAFEMPFHLRTLSYENHKLLSITL